MADEKFLDEEGSGSKKKTQGPKPGAKGKPMAARHESDTVDEVGVDGQTISLFLAVGLIVSALVVGLVVGYMVAPGGSSNNDFGAPTQQAPTLTPEQLKSNQLPPSHPAVPGLNSGGESSQAAPGQAPADNKSGGSSEKPANPKK